MRLSAGALVALVALAGPTRPTAIGAASATAPAARSRIEVHVIGQSVSGRDIVAYRMGTPGGRVVLAVGATHGNEPKGADVTERIREFGPPPGIDLWVIDTINPDGLAARRRTNANGVDINRNFSWNWNYIAPSSATNQYSGAAPADQPETQAIERLVELLQPAVTVWYHQASDRVSAGGARREIAENYAVLVGQRVADTPCSAGCTGTGTQFANHTVPGGTAFLVELPNTSAVTDAMVARHAAAFLAVVTIP